MRPHRWIIRVASCLVPKDARAEWLDEWRAEFHHRESRLGQWQRLTRRERWRLFIRSTGAIWDALWLRTNGWHSLRFLLRHPRIASAAILSLGSALAASLIAFGVYEAVLLRSIGVAEPAQLFVIQMHLPSGEKDMLSQSDAEFFRTNSQAFSGIAATSTGISLVRTPHEAVERAVDMIVSANYFDVLDVHPRLGTLSFPRGSGETANAVVLSERFWQRIGGDPGIVGRRFHIEGGTFRIIGVAPADFHGTMSAWQPDVWCPLAALEALARKPQTAADRDARWLYLIGRLKPGVTEKQASDDAVRLASLRGESLPADQRDRRPFLSPLAAVAHTALDDDGTMRLLFGFAIGVALLTLFTACVNVSNLMLSLAVTRRHEMLVRTSLGASRLQLMMPVLRESLAIGAGAGVLSVWLGSLALNALANTPVPLGPDMPSIIFDVRPDMFVLATTAAVVFAVSLVTGLVPAWRAAADGLSGSLARELAMTGTARRWPRAVMTGVQVAVATVVLFGVGVCTRSASNLGRVDPGFSARNLVYAQLVVSESKSTPTERAAFYDRLRTAVQRVPGVEAVTIANSSPVDNCCARTSRVKPEGSTGEGETVPFAAVDDAYFSTLGIRLLRGRTFGVAEAAGARANEEAVVINETMARSRWPGDDPVGKRLHVEEGNRYARVVGIVADGKYEALDEKPLPFVYYALSQHPVDSLAVVARTSNDARPFARPIRAALMPVLEDDGPAMVRTWEDTVRVELLGPHLELLTIGGLGALALLLTLVGLYGTVFHSVSERRRELSIRLALGAEPRQLMGLMLRQTLWVALPAVAAGIGISQLSLPAIEATLFGVQGVEWFVTAAVTVVVLGSALVTAYFAARPWIRATALSRLRDV